MVLHIAHKQHLFSNLFTKPSDILFCSVVYILHALHFSINMELNILEGSTYMDKLFIINYTVCDGRGYFINNFSFTQSSYWGDHGWKIGDSDDHKARTAYESLLR